MLAQDNRIPSDEVEFNLWTALHRVIRGRWTLVVFTIVGALIGLSVALLWPPWYAAEAVFLPPKNTDLATGVTAPASLLLGTQDSSDMYLGMIMSRTVADYVVDHTGLMQEYHAKMRADARTSLARNSKFTVNKSSLISVDVKARTPKLAADIANAYLEALYRLNGDMVASASEHRRQFFEEQLEQQKNLLSQAEVDLKKTQEQTGIVLPEGEAQAGLLATAQLQAEIGVAETKLAGLLTSETEQNPQVSEARAELAQLRGQLRQQQESTKKSRGAGLASTANLPGLALEYVRKAREVKLREALYDSLTQQYEKAKIASSDPGPQLQIVDRAPIPERKAGPPRTLIVVGATVLGFLCGILFLLLSAPLRRLTREYSSSSAFAG